jgi:hypothetical protein
MDAFFTRYPKEAELETRTATVEGDGDVPPGTYAFLELFCPDVSCDCRRVVISVLSREREVVVATLNYGWENVGFYRKWSGNDPMAPLMKGVTLEPSGTQSPEAEAFRQLFREILLADPRYRTRIQKHYRMFKKWKPI